MFFFCVHVCVHFYLFLLRNMKRSRTEGPLANITPDRVLRLQRISQEMDKRITELCEEVKRLQKENTSLTEELQGCKVQLIKKQAETFKAAAECEALYNWWDMMTDKLDNIPEVSADGITFHDIKRKGFMDGGFAALTDINKRFDRWRDCMLKNLEREKHGKAPKAVVIYTDDEEDDDGSSDEDEGTGAGAEEEDGESSDEDEGAAAAAGAEEDGAASQ